MAKFFQKRTDVSKMSHAILHNKFVLYFIFVLAVGNLFQFVAMNNLLAAIVFILVGLLTSFFSKNMVVIMVVSMVVSNIFKFGTNIRLEGFETDEKDEKKKETETKETKENKEETKENKENKEETKEKKEETKEKKESKNEPFKGWGAAVDDEDEEGFAEDDDE